MAAVTKNRKIGKKIHLHVNDPWATGVQNHGIVFRWSPFRIMSVDMDIHPRCALFGGQKF